MCEPFLEADLDPKELTVECMTPESVVRGGLGVGVDLVASGRIERLIAGPRETGLGWLLTDYEDGEARTIEGDAQHIAHLAVVLAAKRAVLKSLAWDDPSTAAALQQVEVRGADSGHPLVVLYGDVARRANRLGAKCLKLSVTQADGLAMATVIAHE